MSTIINYDLCQKVNRINLSMLYFGQATIKPGWHGEVPNPVFSRLYYIKSGSFNVIDPGKNIFSLTEGKWYLIPSGYSFEYESQEVVNHFYFHIMLCDFGGVDLLRNCNRPLSIDFNDCDFEFLLHCLKETCITSGLMLKQTIFEILISFIKKYNVKINTEDYSTFVYDALTYIKQNLSMQLTISEIAEKLFISKSTLTKHFRKELSMSVNEYICNTIMSEAEQLLISTNYSILDISRKLGFSDQFYFSKKFKGIFGKSPLEYRNSKTL